MSDEIQLSKLYSTPAEGGKGGFKRILSVNKDWETKEYNFFVVLMVKEKKPTYHDTEPGGGSSHGASLTVPSGYNIRAYCHTHPKSIATGNFSSGDKAEFIRVSKELPTVDWYLMNSQEQLRVATTEKDFMAGKSVAWNSSVTP